MTNRLFPRIRPAFWIFLFGFSIHVWNIGVDLPDVFYTDEPHHINKAAAFGTGDLNPHEFKYPTLWSYLLAGMIAALFVAGKITGIVHSAADFAQDYVYHFGFFLYCGRLLSALFLSLLPLVFYRLGQRFYSERFALVIGLLSAISSSLGDFGLQAVPYASLVFFGSCALFAMHGIFQGRGWRAYALTGFFIGLATSCHYVAAPLGALLAAALFVEKGVQPKLTCFAAGIAAAAAGFFAGSPFLLFSFKAAVPHFTEHYELENVSVLANLTLGRATTLFTNIARFSDLWGATFFLALVGTFIELRHRRYRVLAWYLPIAGALPILALSLFGGVWRYCVLLSLPLFIPATQGFLYLLDLCGSVRWRQVALSSVLGGLLALSFFQSRRYVAIADTRAESKQWILTNVPAGEKVLTPGPFDGPPLLKSSAQVARLYERTLELRNPRARYFKTMLDGHPGGGYEVFYVKKTLEEVLDLPTRTKQAFEAQDLIDVASEGVAPLLKNNIDTVVIWKSWENNPRYKAWVAELRAHYALKATFLTEKNKVKGFDLEVYRLRRPAGEMKG